MRIALQQAYLGFRGGYRGYIGMYGVEDLGFDNHRYFWFRGIWWIIWGVFRGYIGKWKRK